jgi:uncharacterized heparinase superfamily protein
MTRFRLTLAALGAPTARRYRGLRNRLRARRAWGASRSAAPALMPEPFLYGDSDRGRQLVAGEWAPLGRTVTLGPRPIWDAAVSDPRFEIERQSFGWLDDLAALGTRTARGTAQGWTLEWVRRFGKGRGIGWRPEVAGRRMLHLAAHARFLADGLSEREAGRLWRSLAAHGRLLARGWPDAAPGLPRVEALAGAVLSHTMSGDGGLVAAVRELGALADAMIDPDGATPSRAPGDLAETVILLVWTARLLESAGRHAAPSHLHALARALPVLRALRLGDGTTARFHGGGPGMPERLDQALAELRVGPQPKPRLPMGFARLSGGRLVAVMDGAAPPTGPEARHAHAGTLAFELTVARQPLVVNAGPGHRFGPAAARAARSTGAHSTVEIDGASSARFSSEGLAARAYGPWIEEGPSLVTVRQAQDHTGQWLLATHDGYVETHGLLHERRLFVDARGQECRGEDIVYVTDGRARDRFDRVARDRPEGRVLVVARFHLAPGVKARLDTYREIVELDLPGGDVWILRCAGGRLELADSAHFDPSAAAPIPTRQILVIGEVIEYLGQINWSFTRRAGLPEARPAGPRAPRMP